LERIGDRYAGVIERVNYDPKAPDRVVVSFERAGRAQTARLSADDLHSGSEVTVLVDPDHPDQITLEGHRQQSALAHGLTLLLLVTGTVVLPPIACLMIVQAVWRWRHTRSRMSSPLSSRPLSRSSAMCRSAEDGAGGAARRPGRRRRRAPAPLTWKRFPNGCQGVVGHWS
jgi:hypothetical protein